MRRAVSTALTRSLSLLLHSSSSPSSLLHSPPQTLTLRLFCSPSIQCQCRTPEPELEPVSTAAAKLGVDQNILSVFQKWGCSHDEVAKILQRHPPIARMKLSLLHSQLEILHGFGFIGSDLVHLVTCRPRFLARQKLVHNLRIRLDFLRTLFPSLQMVIRVVIRNPSVLCYKLDRMKRCVEVYESMGVTRHEFGVLLNIRPTIVCRTNLDSEEKIDLIRRTCVKHAKMYKYVVSIIAISRIETIQTKITNLEKFELCDDDVLKLFGKTPNIMTLSVEKVQRNMTFIVGTMKLPASIVLQSPELLYTNLDKVMKPRYLLVIKIQEMGLELDTRSLDLLMPSVVRMREPRFLRAFVTCREKSVEQELMEFYNGVKGVRRLAETSRLNNKGFPF